MLAFSLRVLLVIIEREGSHLSHSTQAALNACFDSCKELPYVQIMCTALVPENLEAVEFTTPKGEANVLFHPITMSTEGPACCIGTDKIKNIVKPLSHLRS